MCVRASQTHTYMYAAIRRVLARNPLYGPLITAIFAAYALLSLPLTLLFFVHTPAQGVAFWYHKRTKRTARPFLITDRDRAAYSLVRYVFYMQPKLRAYVLVYKLLYKSGQLTGPTLSLLTKQAPAIAFR